MADTLKRSLPYLREVHRSSPSDAVAPADRILTHTHSPSSSGSRVRGMSVPSALHLPTIADYSAHLPLRPSPTVGTLPLPGVKATHRFAGHDQDEAIVQTLRCITVVLSTAHVLISSHRLHPTRKPST
ncbi:unnamed protein product [Clonostachys solani]|uniref:Uncharacterized protein n=1 Tax=Clonostachys solani TaxID=160281 RepID=A0A9P0ETD4_9HYPO|nr:unnamed protein product [Clonostachys solani]